MTLLSTLIDQSTTVPLAADLVQGIDTIATAAQTALAVDDQSYLTPVGAAGTAGVGNGYVGYHVPGRTYTVGQIVALNGALHRVQAASTVTTPPGTDWGPVYAGNAPLPGGLTVNPNPIGSGAGTIASPYIINPITAPQAGFGTLVDNLVLTGLPPGAFVEIADLTVATTGGRLAISNRYVSGDGTFRAAIVFNDTPTSLVGAVYNFTMKIGDIRLSGTINVAAPTLTVVAPSITAPANGATGVSTSPVVTTSAFATLNGADTHASSDWEIYSDVGLTILARQSLTNTVNKVSWTPSPALSSNTVYYLRVRHRGTTAGAGAWSSTVQFTTVSVTVATPSITAPANGATSIAVSPTFTSSAFALGSGADTHGTTDWQVATDAGFTAIVQQSISDGTNKVSWTPPNLNQATTYYVRCRYRSTTSLVYSLYSATVSFTTVVPFGLNWTFGNGGITNSMRTACAGTGGVMLAISYQLEVFRSTNYGVNWNYVSNIPDIYGLSPTTGSEANISYVAAANRFIVRKSSYNGSSGGFYHHFIYASTDNGSSWAATAAPIYDVGTNNVTGIFQAENGRMIYSYYDFFGGGPSLLRWSDDGITWTTVDISALGFTSLPIAGFSYKAGVYVIAYQSGYVGSLRSTDNCATWVISNPSIPNSIAGISGYAVSGLNATSTHFVLGVTGNPTNNYQIGIAQFLSMSTDGITWTSKSVPFGGFVEAAGDELISANYGPSYSIGIRPTSNSGQYGFVYTSSDMGSTWKVRNCSNFLTFYSTPQEHTPIVYCYDAVAQKVCWISNAAAVGSPGAVLTNP